MKDIEYLYRTTKDKHVKNISRILHGNMDTAEDVFHNAITRAVSYFPTFDDRKGKIEGWFTRIVYNELSRYLRKEKKFYSEDIENWKDNEQCSNLNERIIFNIDKYNSDILRLIFLCGYTQKETASILNIKEYVVKQTCIKFKEDNF